MIDPGRGWLEPQSFISITCVEETAKDESAASIVSSDSGLSETDPIDIET